MAKRLPELKSGTNPLAEVDDGLVQGHLRKSNELIYESIMRGGGEPFGPPFEIGTGSLTERVVKLFKQKSFFAFETIEKTRRRARRNKFTRYAAAPFRGPHKPKKT